MKLRIALLLAQVMIITACSPSEENASPAPTSAPAVAPATDTESVTGDGVTDAEVEDYLRLFPYQDTFNYVMRYTGGEVAALNTWVLGTAPKLVKAGEDKVVRMNNDTFYKMAFVYLEDQPVYLKAETPDQSRFVSFQLMDDRNANYRNIIFPSGEFTLYRGSEPEVIRGEAIAVPSALSVVIVRVEVKNPGDADDVTEAEQIFRSITIEGAAPGSFPEVDVLSGFSDAVESEAKYRMAQAFGKIPFRKMVVGPGKIPGEHVPYLNHAMGTKGGWGGPATDHSSYETIQFGRDQQPLIGANGTYSVTTEAPPVEAFWSLTVYDTERGGFLHPNKHDRYHINNTLAVANADGAYTFLFKRDCTDDDVNCLEVPPGQFDIAARYYLPSESIQTGEWVLPPLELAD